MENNQNLSIEIDTLNLEKIDLLIKQKVYSNRNQFINEAITELLKTKEKKEWKFSKTFVAGIITYDKKSLETILEKGEMLDINALGSLTIKDDVTPELASKTINSIKVRGHITMNDSIRQVLQDRIVS